MAQAIFDKKNILVTGGAGFIGSFLCEALVQKAKVICVDNFISGSHANIEQLLRNPNFIFVKHDINTPIDLAAFPELERFKVQFQGIQEIYHFACPTSPKDFMPQRIETLRANTLGMHNALDLAVKYQARFVQISSSVVYGPRPENNAPFAEEYLGIVDFLSPRACYDEGKRFAETIVATYRDFYKVDARIARVFRTYGPRMPLREGHMIPDFITAALDHQPLVIYGDEHFMTSLCYVTDIVDGLQRLMDAASYDGPINIGSDVDVRLMDVATTIISMTGSQSKVEFADPLLFMTPLGLPDIRRAKEMLGWLPIVPLDQGLKESIDYTMATKGLKRA
ncbi:NAD-dependent epimerase/dehydratase family protein [Candidatus Uhrbacteria bacterium]|nr:NAD-dependent epimerase/dehydratase family protein [Candidatus Uhrbacteria bacterium]